MKNSIRHVTRRRFLQEAGVLTAGVLLCPRAARAGTVNGQDGIRARFYETRENRVIQCRLCPWECVVKPGDRGRCGVRENRNGTYISTVYGRIAARHTDPIEKKPFFHFLPGTMAFSIATAGCNVDCKFCQNWELAQRRPEDVHHVPFSPFQIAEQARQYQARSIAYTYNEPTVFYEYLTDIAVEAGKIGLRNVAVSNGFINRKPLLELIPLVDAYKVDLKSFEERYYRDIVGGRLQPVLDTLVTLRSRNVWTEIVYLTVPELNDDTGMIKRMAAWIRDELGPDVPLHFSRFYPRYKLRNLPPTPVETLDTLRKTAMDAGLHYVYLGNVPGHGGENTWCPSCGKRLISRLGYRVVENHVNEGRCDGCAAPIAGVWA